MLRTKYVVEIDWGRFASGNITPCLPALVPSRESVAEHCVTWPWD